VSCPSASQCTATDNHGYAVTFNPGTPGTPTPAPVDAPPANQVYSVACPSTTQCTAVDGRGYEVTFNPLAPAGASPRRIPGANQFYAVACPALFECFAVDTVGNGFAGFVPPANTSPPTISGTPRAGHILTEAHGGWTNNPTSFAYQWLRCDTGGNNCVAISGATSQTYAPTAADAGHTIRVRETASNPGGSGSATSAPTSVVAAGPSASTRPATGVSTTAATLHGVIDTRGEAVTWQFQFGQSTHYNKGTPIHTIAAGRTKPVVVSWKLTHLRANTTYHFRLVAIIQPRSDEVPLASNGRDLRFTTKATGKLLLGFSVLKVHGRTALVPLRCSSRLNCNGRFSITTRVRVGKSKKTASVLCDTTFFRIGAGKKKSVRAKIYSGCLALLHQARGHRLKAQFTSRPRTGQFGIVKSVTLTL
jgi:hypothetical protein